MNLKRGATSVTIPVFAQDTTSVIGGGKTGLLYNTASLICYYKRELDTASHAVTLATMTLGTWASGGFKEADATHMPGMYDFGLPDAAISASDASKWVVIQFTGASGAFLAPIRIDLEAVDRQDTVRSGLTALPNALAAANGGLYTRGTGAGQINQAANGQIDANVVAVAGSSSAATKQGGAAASIISGAAATGTLTTTQMTTSLAETNADQYVGRAVVFTSGLLVGQAATITGYTPTGGKLTVTELTDAPSNGDTFVIV